MTPHDYDQMKAEEVFTIALEFLPYAKELLERLEK